VKSFLRFTGYSLSDVRLLEGSCGKTFIFEGPGAVLGGSWGHLGTILVHFVTILGQKSIVETLQHSQTKKGTIFLQKPKGGLRAR